MTELESQVIDVISDGDYFDDLPACSFEDITDITGLNANVVKGVLSSLTKKDVLRFAEYPNGIEAYLLKDEFNPKL